MQEHFENKFARSPKVAVCIPCYNEEISIGKVVRDFSRELPQATIYVYNNNSQDRTDERARAAGANVFQETQQGKGHVVRRIFRDINADFYVLVDGDDTYDATVAAKMLELAESEMYDLVNCARKQEKRDAYRTGHRWGNSLLTGAVRILFGNRVEDMLSGYKVFSRRFVKSFPTLSQGFDIETELTVHALGLSLPIANVWGAYGCRPNGSDSKLRTYRDGFHILMLILKLVRHERPLFFFGVIAVLLALLSISISTPVLLVYLKTGLVPQLPTALLSTGIMLIGALSLLAGIILDTVSRGRREIRLLFYLAYPPFGNV